jgi:hypothetical protein
VTVDNGRSCYLKEAAHPDGPFLVSAYEACHSPAVAASLQTRIRNWRSSWTFYRDARRFVPQNPRWLVTHATAKKQMKRLSGLRPMSSIHKTRPSKSNRHDRGPSWKVFGIGLILASVQGRYHRHRSILRTVRKTRAVPSSLKTKRDRLGGRRFSGIRRREYVAA